MIVIKVSQGLCRATYNVMSSVELHAMARVRYDTLMTFTSLFLSHRLIKMVSDMRVIKKKRNVHNV